MAIVGSARTLLAARSALAAFATIAPLAAFASRLPFTAACGTITFRQCHRRCVRDGRLTLWRGLGRALFALATAIARWTLFALGTLALFAPFVAVASAAAVLLDTGLTFCLYRCCSFLARLLLGAVLRLAMIATVSALARLAPLFVAIAPVAPGLFTPAAAIPLGARRGLLFRFGSWGTLEQAQETPP